MRQGGQWALVTNAKMGAPVCRDFLIDPFNVDAWHGKVSQPARNRQKTCMTGMRPSFIDASHYSNGK
jgi:hypothetical protein